MIRQCEVSGCYAQSAGEAFYPRHVAWFPYCSKHMQDGCRVGKERRWFVTGPSRGAMLAMRRLLGTVIAARSVTRGQAEFVGCVADDEEVGLLRQVRFDCPAVQARRAELIREKLAALEAKRTVTVGWSPYG